MPSRTDICALLGFTVLCGALAFLRLGDTRAPRTFYAAEVPGQSVIADLGTESRVLRLTAYVGFGAGSYVVELSSDGTHWEPGTRIEQPTIYGMIEWRAADLDLEARYIRVIAEKPGLQLGEIGVFGQDRRILPLKALRGEGTGNSDPGRLFDEQHVAAYTPSYLNGMYFDETYFARTAVEYVAGARPTETTHPPLGKLILALGVLLFGATPFGWRFMPALAGALSVPLFYLLARRLLRKPAYALLAAILFTFDFMRFVQARIATVDMFIVFFVILAFWCVSRFSESPGRAWPWLLAAGASVGAAAACKWSGAYAGPGVAVIFIAVLWTRERSPAPAVFGKALLLAAGCLVAAPVLVYVASYIPDMVRNGVTFRDLLSMQGAMFAYHSGVTETRWYASRWWEWPLLVRPVWLYSGRIDVPAGSISSIVTMGNPAVWWVGAAAMPLLAVVGARTRSRAAGVALAGFLCMYLPWLVSPRSLQFIYYFFSSVPFMILGAAHLLETAASRWPRIRYAAFAWAAVGVALFAMFFPILSGVVVPRAYAEALHWFRTWIIFPG